MPHFDVFYMKKEFFGDGIMGVEWCRKKGCLPNPRTLGDTHAYVKMLEAKNLGDVFLKMQAEYWSPNGEACELIAKANLTHTSMSVGDIIVTENGVVLMFDNHGFQELNDEKVS